VLIQPELGRHQLGIVERMPRPSASGGGRAQPSRRAARYSLPKAAVRALRKRQIVPRSDTLGRIDEIRFEVWSGPIPPY